LDDKSRNLFFKGTAEVPRRSERGRNEKSGKKSRPMSKEAGRGTAVRGDGGFFLQKTAFKSVRRKKDGAEKRGFKRSTTTSRDSGNRGPGKRRT